MDYSKDPMTLTSFEWPPKSYRSYYAPIEPYHQGHLKVSSLHEIYYEESGNPQGKPIVFLHGGPGAGTSPEHRRFFDPAHYRIILFDQRGCGKSRPYASLEENTTWHLVEDMEKLRTHLRINSWIVFGGSWGSTLALSYAITYPHRVDGLILRGIFTMKPYELEFLYKEGASYLFPEGWEEFVSIIPPKERDDLIAAYYRIVTGDDEELKQKAAVLWTKWEARTNRLIADPELVQKMTEDRYALSFARTETHYFHHRGFLPSPNFFVEQVHKIRQIPTIIVHGRYDLVCPVRSAWELHQEWPEAALYIVPDAGHSATEKGNLHFLIEATDQFRRLE